MNQQQKYLLDIQESIKLILEFAEDVKSFEAYQLDLKTQSAIERQLIIIGEAIYKLNKLEGFTPFNNQEKIIGFRHRLVHAYDAIDDTMVWAILKLHLKNLEDELLERIKL